MASIIYNYPKQKSDFESAPEKFIIKFSSARCPPCSSLQSYLDEGHIKPEEDLHIYQIQIQGETKQEEIFSTMREFFSFKSFPFCVVTNKKFENIDNLVGFRKENFFAFVKNNFKLKE